MVLCRLLTGYLEPNQFTVLYTCTAQGSYLVIPVSLCRRPNMMSARLLWPSRDLWSWNTWGAETGFVYCTRVLYNHRVNNVAVTLEDAGVLPPDVGRAEDEAAVVREDGGQ